MHPDSAPEQVVALPATRVAGRIRVPSSKSLTQRALVAAALAGGGARVSRPLDAEDPRLLAAALATLGFRLRWEGDEVVADGFAPAGSGELFLGNNGTGARFVLAQAAALPGRWRLDGVARLRERPIAALVSALGSMGAALRAAGGGRLPVEIEGRTLAGGEVVLDPAASSQFVSALLLLAPRLPHGLVVRLATTPPSRPYLALTLEVLECFGAEVGVDEEGRTFTVRPGALRPTRFEVEGDWSAAAFPLAAAAVAGGEAEVAGLRRDSRQGDAVVAGLLASSGCRLAWTDAGLRISGPAERPLVADLRDCPDLFPALAAVVASTGGELRGLEGLAGKESDRLAVMTDRLTAMGFGVRAEAGRFISAGGGSDRAPAAPLDPAGDHRIAMALAVAGLVVPGTAVAGAGCVAKSWPGFWEAWGRLCG